ncbi:hypothetical protein [Pseudomonas sp. CCC3.1]|uniref:hypothetical protein n=1 Tax=Pseudomonas sp. CCC3.1 TaxID=3048607 RepID=UPI002AC9D5CE|nr:hypothetical protein [Pseudomonas sp. CCC3.1]MEB0204692.1 hypothetical protein [Pseudomonas sp. CCC3.1]WPX38614.1 hypothetical protein RHM56_10715 [Pseudomonas sp. CCC3.1]
MKFALQGRDISCARRHFEQIDALEHVQRFEFDIAGQPFTSWLDGVALLKSTTYNTNGHVEIEQAGNDVTTTAYYSPQDGLRS